MKRTTITITDDLERAIESYRQDFDIPLELDAVVRSALTEYLADRGYLVVEPGMQHSMDHRDFIPGTGPKPEPLANAPVLDEEHSVSAAVIEDRR